MKRNKNYYGTIGNYELEIPGYAVLDCSQSGPVDTYVETYATHDNRIKAELSRITKDDAKYILFEYGAWDEHELKDHNRNLERILWIVCCNIYDDE